MKKYIIIGITSLILLLSIIITICISIKINRKNNLKDIERFHFFYTVGWAYNSDVDYAIDCTDKVCIASIKPKDTDITKQVEIGKKFINKVLDIIKGYKLGKWDGYDKNAKNIYDGDVFEFYVRSSNDESIDASGYEKWPSHYKEVKDKLDKLFMNLYKKN